MPHSVHVQLRLKDRNNQIHEIWQGRVSLPHPGANPWFAPTGEMLAFPGAEGFGALSKGGRGGRIIEVTNLNGSGPGSFRACAGASGPRVCVFRVSGTIEMLEDLRITAPYLTVAGQTAPGGGITIKTSGGIKIYTHDVIMRYIRVRNVGGGQPGQGQLNFHIGDGASNNVILDHCSTSWSFDENIAIHKNQVGSPDMQNITVQRCIVAEGLWPHSTGIQMGGEWDLSVSPQIEEYNNVHHASVHHNLFAHNSHRNPRVGTPYTEVINNVTYNWYGRIGEVVHETISDFINNYWKPGPMSQPINWYWDNTAGHGGVYLGDISIYIAGNIIEKRFPDPNADNWPMIQIHYGPDAGKQVPQTFRRFIPLPKAPMPVTIHSATEAYSSVVADAGANARLDCRGNWVPNSDSVDLRILQDVINRTGWDTLPPQSVEEAGGFPTIASVAPCQDSDHDGMPDEWEIAHGLNPNGSPTDAWILDLDGVAMLDHFLNGTEPRV